MVEAWQLSTIHVSLGLTEGPLPCADRLAILRAGLAPTADRGNGDEDGERQDHFAAFDQDWELTYENATAHQIRVAFPPADGDLVRATPFPIIARMGCDVRSVHTFAGAPVPWAPMTMADCRGIGGDYDRY